MVFIGSVFWMCHHSMVTGLPDVLAPVLLSLLSSPPQATTVTASAAARTPAARRSNLILTGLLLLCMKSGRRHGRTYPHRWIRQQRLERELRRSQQRSVEAERRRDDAHDVP